MSKDVFIVGEDPVSRAITKRIIKDYAPSLNIVNFIPARGSDIKRKMCQINKVAINFPVILLSDLDTDPCAPVSKKILLKDIETKSPNLVVNIAVDEAEAWLFADREGFANYLGVPIEKMPQSSRQCFQGSKPIIEIELEMKASWYLTHYLIVSSTKKVLKEQLYSNSRCKGKEYNPAIIPFIENIWNIESARLNSDSLNRMINRVQYI